MVRTPRYYGDITIEDGMGQASELYGGFEKFMQGFGGETWKKETTWKTQI